MKTKESDLSKTPDVDSLFPEPEIQQLLKDIASDLHEVRQFVSGLRRELETDLAQPHGTNGHFPPVMV